MSPNFVKDHKIGNKRAPWIDYRKPGIFMITMNILNGLPHLCGLERNPNITDPVKAIQPNYRPLGFSVYEVFLNFDKLAKGLRKLQYIIMPDHIHFIVEIYEELEFVLGHYLSIFKVKVLQRAKEKGVVLKNQTSVFQPGYNDQFLKSNRSLDVLFNYLRKNPYKLWVRWNTPEYFRHVAETEVCGIKSSLYGNPDLLGEVFKSPVVYHRAYSRQEYEAKIAEWEYTLYNGGILVGAFVNPNEKVLFEKAKEFGGKVILISDRRYGEREKPSGELYEMCEKGNLLIISPHEACNVQANDFRKSCLFRNNMAELICKRKA